MKKALIIITVFFGLLAHAQQEIKADLFDGLALKTLELSYEHYIGDQSSIGIAALFNFERRSSDFRYNEKEMFTPFFRHYFSDNQTWNYFGEVFFGINTGEREVSVLGSDKKSYISYTDGALGISVGSKYISNGGFVIDIYGGLGRNLFTEKSRALVIRVGLNVGYRF